MFVGQRSVRIIVLSLIVFLLAINFALWNFNSYLESRIIDVDFNFREFQGYINSYEFKGFSWFFDRIATFPGIQNTRDFLNSIFKIVSGFHVENVNAWDVVGAIINLFMSPIILLLTILADLITNVIWFFGFFLE